MFKTKFSLSQVISLAILGLEAYDAQNANGGPSIFLNPTVTTNVLGEVLGILNPTAPAAPTTPVA